MADEEVDLLKIKIEKAKRDLPLETVNAIDAVDWHATILGLRDRYGYSLEQLGDLELETELVLCGLVSPQAYPREIEIRMDISKAKADELVNEMNELVFKKIREELIKNTERKKIFAKKNDRNLTPTPLMTGEGKARGEMRKIKEGNKIPELQSLELTGNVIHPMIAQKFSGSFQVPIKETQHTLENITKVTAPIFVSLPIKPKVDPYREIPE